MEEKTKHPFQGKLQGKLFRLCAVLVIITAVSFALVGVFQMRMEMTFSDNVIPFDPLKWKAEDLSTNIADRKRGGLGLL